MELKKILKECLEKETDKKPFSHRIVDTLIVLVLVAILFPLLNAGLRRIDKDYDKRWVKWDVRIERYFNLHNQEQNK